MYGNAQDIGAHEYVQETNPADTNSDSITTTEELVKYIREFNPAVSLYSKVIDAVRGWFFG